MADSSGAKLALLLLGGFHSMADEVVRELDRRGHPGVRPAHEFALRAIDGGADTASELGRRLSVSKQAAAKTIASLQRLGYVEVTTDPSDRRRKCIRVSTRGREMTTIGAALFDDVRDRWATQIGLDELEVLEKHLSQLVVGRPLGAEDLTRPGGDLGDKRTGSPLR